MKKIEVKQIRGKEFKEENKKRNKDSDENMLCD